MAPAPAGPGSAPEPSKDTLLATIVHVSDLHFGSGYTPELGRRLESWIAELRPQAVVVSGDLADHPRPRLFRRAAGLLERIASYCEEKNDSRPLFVVVPGNHDRKLFGNLSLGYWARLLFRTYFGEQPGAADLSTRKARQRRYRSLIRQDLSNSWKRWRNGDVYRNSPLWHGTVAGGDVIFAAYDSNDAWLAATGRVRSDQIGATGEIFAPGAAQGGAEHRPCALRVAVVHHHAVPIPYADSDEITNVEAFLVLENAGTFLREMVASDFDLILHGHKHYSGFTRISYHLNPLEQGEIGVLAAGSATLGSPNHLRANSLNVIRLYNNGRAVIEMWEFAHGRLAHLASHTPYALELHTPTGLKQRAFRRHYAACKISAEALRLSVQLDEGGNSLIRYKVDGLLSGQSDVQGYKIWARTQIGLFRDPCLSDDSRRNGMLWVESAGETDSPGPGASFKDRLERLRQVNGHLGFPALNKAVGFEMMWYQVGCHAMTDWEYALLYRAGDGIGRNAPRAERITYTVWHPLERLELRLRLPASIPGAPYLEVERNPAIGVPIRGAGGILERNPPAPPKEGWTPDAFMREEEKRHLRHDGDTGDWVLEIDRPMVGHRYALKWDLPRTKRGAIPEMLVAEAETFRRALIRHGLRRRGKPAEAASESVRAMMRDFHQTMRSLFPSRDAEEHFDVSIMAYDADSGYLVAVEGVCDAGELPEQYWTFEVPPGVGNAGAAFRTGRAHVYVSDKVKPESDYYVPVEAQKPHQVLISLPLDHPGLRDLPEPESPDVLAERRWQVAAVLNLGSSSKASTLRCLYPENPHAARAPEYLAAVHALSQDLLNRLWQELLPGAARAARAPDGGGVQPKEGPPGNIWSVDLPVRCSLDTEKMRRVLEGVASEPRWDDSRTGPPKPAGKRGAKQRSAKSR